MPPARSNSTDSQASQVSSGGKSELSSGFEACFESRLEKKYICPICLAALRNPVQTKCGHRFCKTCILRACNGHSRLQARCPIDKISFDVKTELFEDVAFKREILSLTVLCANKEEGCVWNGELRELEDHSDDCPFASEICPNGCNKNFLRKDSTSHESECELRFIDCSHCNEQVIYRDLLMHHQQICRRFPVDCNQCGKTGLLREELSDHLDINTGDCPDVIVPCSYKAMGCSEMIPRKHLAGHEEGAASRHLQLVVQNVSDLKNVMAGQETLLRDVQEMCNQLVCKQVDFARQLEEKEEQLNLQREKIRELSSTSYNGILYWKVTLPSHNYTTPIISPVIYTNRPGYKFQICLELRGHAARNETYASLFAMLCHGDFDEQLFFPFNGTCRVTLLNQSSRGHGSCSSDDSEMRDHVTSVECFNIPRVENASSQSQKRGRLRYMKTDALIKGRYCQNGVLYFKVEIHSNRFPALSKAYNTSRSL